MNLQEFIQQCNEKAERAGISRPTRPQLTSHASWYSYHESERIIPTLELESIEALRAELKALYDNMPAATAATRPGYPRDDDAWLMWELEHGGRVRAIQSVLCQRWQRGAF